MCASRRTHSFRGWSATEDPGRLLEPENQWGDRDLDADAGALLVRPTRIVATHPFDDARLRALARRIGS